MVGDTRWSCADLESAVSWVRVRNGQDLRCIMAPYGRFAMSRKVAEANLDLFTHCVRRIRGERLKASLAVKLSYLGAAFDPRLCRDLVSVLLEDADENDVRVELDMEGEGFVPFTVGMAIDLLGPHDLTVTLQAYLDRTLTDLRQLLDAGSKIRLVKGTYSGDISDFEQIQDRILDVAQGLLADGVPFTLGTHDPVIIQVMRGDLIGRKKLVEFGFLKGLANETKLTLASDGHPVAEYVPYGAGGEAYEARRMNYEVELAMMGRLPMP